MQKKQSYYALQAETPQAAESPKRNSRQQGGTSEASSARKGSLSRSRTTPASLPNETSSAQKTLPPAASGMPFLRYFGCKDFDILLISCRLQKNVSKFGSKVRNGTKQTILSEQKIQSVKKATRCTKPTKKANGARQTPKSGPNIDFSRPYKPHYTYILQKNKKKSNKRFGNSKIVPTFASANEK